MWRSFQLAARITTLYQVGQPTVNMRNSVALAPDPKRWITTGISTSVWSRLSYADAHRPRRTRSTAGPTGNYMITNEDSNNEAS